MIFIQYYIYQFLRDAIDSCKVRITSDQCEPGNKFAVQIYSRLPNKKFHRNAFRIYLKYAYRCIEKHDLSIVRPHCILCAKDVYKLRRNKIALSCR